MESTQRKRIKSKTRQYCKHNNRNSTRQKSFTCVYANEWDKYAAKIYEKNFGERPDTRDITTVDADEIPDHDLLTGGFPCQSFSIAGKRKGFEDTRGTLFFDIARILNSKRSRMCLLENVKGLLSHDNGDTFRTILWVLYELGYDVQWQVLNSKNWVPQNRERVFIIGHIRGGRRPEIFPFRESKRLPQEGGKKRKIENKFSTAITQNLKRGVHSGGETLIYEGAIMSEKNKKWLENGKELSRNFPQGQRVYSSDGIASAIAGNAGGLGGKTGLYAIPVLTPDREKKRQFGRRFKDNGEPSFTLTGQDIHGIFDGLKIRRLTPIECERLQGFPDNWTEGVSDTQRYKMLGNAVTTNIITEIGKRLLNETK